MTMTPTVPPTAPATSAVDWLSLVPISTVVGGWVVAEFMVPISIVVCGWVVAVFGYETRYQNRITMSSIFQALLQMDISHGIPCRRLVGSK